MFEKLSFEKIYNRKSSSTKQKKGTTGRIAPSDNFTPYTKNTITKNKIKKNRTRHDDERTQEFQDND